MGALGIFAIQQSSANTRELAAQIAGVAADYAASSVDPALLPAIVEGAEGTEEYKTILNALYKVMSTNPIFFAYTLTTDGTNVYNGVVAGFEEKIGTKSTVVYSHVEPAFNGTTVQDKTIHKTAYGHLINSYVPIKDDTGKVIAILGCAYNAADVTKKAETLSNIVIAAMIIGVVLMSALCYVLVQRVTKPLASATKIIRDVRECNLREYKNLSVPNNEIGDIIHDSVSMSDSLRLIINDIREMLDQMGHGNFLVKSTCEESYIGAYSEILASINEISSRLRETLSEIYLSSQQVNTGAEQIAAGAQTVSQGATEQASAVEELTASVEEVAAQTSRNAKNAGKANELAINAMNNAKNGDAQMCEMLKAMDAINISSGNISKIIKVIDDIAFQTNILALNAAVEAARAGQHGKGFAVVAEEVRTLAAKSANAAKETTDMIEGSIRNVEAGIKIANDTAGALKKIVTEVSNAAELVGAIADASNEQSQGIEQISQGITQVSQVVQMNAAISEESAAAGEELASQANQLKDVVSIFKINQSNELRSPEQTVNRMDPEEKPASKALADDMSRKHISLSGDFGKY
ncbi:MAG: hypothetical protein GXY05_16550 [Clostridiales bacterium]|nr:hypothetical protein [Clostridiales bacterium]